MSLKKYQFNYPNAGISSVKSLAEQLRVDEELLLDLIKDTTRHYRVAKVVKKADGSQRVTYDASQPLKSILTRLRKRILDKVKLPNYVLAGVKGKSYIDNAKIHVASKALLSEDIKSFFPQVKSEHIYRVFKFLFKMPDRVAEVATALCTMNGTLVQGSPISGSIANLIFFKQEPALVHDLENRGFRYTRYYDDVSISSIDSDFKDEIRKLRQYLYGMFRAVDLSPHRGRSKSHYTNNGGRMSVHGIIVNNANIQPNPKIESDVRVMLYSFSKTLETDYEIEQVIKSYRSITGKLQTLLSQGRKDVAKYKKQLAILISKIDEKKAKCYARKLRKVKSKKELSRLSGNLSIICKISPRVSMVVKSEKFQVTKRLG